MNARTIRDPWNPSRSAIARIKDPMQPPAHCDCCGGSVRIAHHREIYGGRSFGEWPWVYACDCGARVGMHPGTNIPLGTMADAKTRDARKACKPAFEAIWRHGHMTREEAYEWLAIQLRIHVSKCHFGMFSAAQCERARMACVAYLETLS